MRTRTLPYKISLIYNFYIIFQASTSSGDTISSSGLRRMEKKKENEKKHGMQLLRLGVGPIHISARLGGDEGGLLDADVTANKKPIVDADVVTKKDLVEFKK